MLTQPSQRAVAPLMAATIVGGSLIPAVALAEAPADQVRVPAASPLVAAGC